MKKIIISALLLILPVYLCGCTYAQKHEREKALKILEEKYSHYENDVFIKDVISSLYETDEIIFKLLFLNNGNELDKIIDNELAEYIPYYSADIKITCSDHKIKNYIVSAANKKNTQNLSIEFDENGNIVKIFNNKQVSDKFKTESAFKEYITENRLNTENAITTACSRKRDVKYNPADYI